MASVLLIEKDVKVREHFKNIFNHLGHTIMHKTDTISGLADICSTYKTDYICIDLYVDAILHRNRLQPSLNEAIKKLRDNGTKSKIIIITPYSMEDTILSLLKSGANDYLFKPISLNDVKRVFS